MIDDPKQIVAAFMEACAADNKVLVLRMLSAYDLYLPAIIDILNYYHMPAIAEHVRLKIAGRATTA